MMRAGLKLLAAAMMLAGINTFAQLVVVAPYDQVWKYHSLGQDLGTDWRSTTYDDVAWPEGPGPLGFPVGENTQISGHSIRTVIPRTDANGTVIRTHYFRTTFDWTNSTTSGVTITFTNNMDDGAVLYLNGVEIGRVGMPEGEVIFSTEASRANEVGDHRNEVVTAVVDLLPGENVLAVEVHQGGSSSSDSIMATHVEVYAPAPVSIISPPVGGTIIEGNTLTVSVGVDDPNASVQWFKDGEPLEGGTNLTLNVENAGPGHAGSYFVVVQNQFNTATSDPVTFTVSPLTVVSPPADVTTTEGTEVRFTVEANGPAGYRWFFNGTQIDPFFNPTAADATLVLNSVQVSDAGEYSVIVSNAFRELPALTALLTINNDSTPPEVVSARAETNTIIITFSEPVFGDNAFGSGAADPFNYTVTENSAQTSIGIAAATVNGAEVVLTLAEPLVDGRSYTLGFNASIEDLFGNAMSPTTTSPILVPLIVFPRDSVWRIEFTGPSEPAGWGEPGFDDSGWFSGPAPIGQETSALEWPLNTQIGNFSPYTGARVTYYFRSTLNMPAAMTNGILQLFHQIDDSVIIYINGEEVSRFNFDGEPCFTCPGAGGAVGEAAVVGPIILTNIILNAGANTIAAEVHQIGGNSSDMVFGVELIAFLGELPSDPPMIDIQPQPVTVNEGSNATFSVGIDVSSMRPLTYQWFLGSTPIVDGTNDVLILNAVRASQAGNISVRVENAAGTAVSDPALLTVIPDTNAPTVTAIRFLGTNQLEIVFSENVRAGTIAEGAENIANYTVSGSVITGAVLTNNNTVVLTLQDSLAPGTALTVNVQNVGDLADAINRVNSTSELSVLVPITALWSFDNLGLDLGDGWIASDFDDSAWQTAVAPLGTEASTSANLVLTNVPLTANNITYYFRHEFAAEPGARNLHLRYLVDDGFVVHLNGQEIHRYNLPTNEITHATEAPAANPAGEGVWLEAIITNATLQAQNTLAVEVHQAGATSSDVVLALGIIATASTGEPDAPELNFSRSGTSITFTWEDPSYHLEVSTTLEANDWTDVSGSNNSGTTVNTTDGTRAFYRLANE